MESRLLADHALGWLVCVCQGVGVGYLDPRISLVQMVIIFPNAYFTFYSPPLFKFIFLNYFFSLQKLLVLTYSALRMKISFPDKVFVALVGETHRVESKNVWYLEYKLLVYWMYL